jgi:hypothetical protein
MEAHAFATTEFTPDSYAVSVLPVIEQFVAGRGDAAAADASAWAAEARELGERGEFFFACIQCCFSATS